MVTLDEYFEMREKMFKIEIELINLRAAFRLSYAMLDVKAKEEMKYSLGIFNVSEETKTHIMKNNDKKLTPIDL